MSRGMPGFAGRVAHYFINSKLTPLLMVFSILLGVFAVLETPREEEPQIIVPMMDVFVEMPGAKAQEVEQRVATPMEKLLWEIPGVEYVYSTSRPGMCMAIVRFKVGEKEDDSIECRGGSRARPGEGQQPEGKLDPFRRAINGHQELW